jgi:hypothetical protein
MLAYTIKSCFGLGVNYGGIMKNDNLKWEPLTEVPERLVGDRKLALQFLLKHADKVEMAYLPKSASRYRAYFDDGVFKGAFVFTWRQAELTPLNVYLTCVGTGWPGFNLVWLENFAAQTMAKDMGIQRQEAA